MEAWRIPAGGESGGVPYLGRSEAFAHSLEEASLSDASHEDRAAEELVRTADKDPGWSAFHAATPRG